MLGVSFEMVADAHLSLIIVSTLVSILMSILILPLTWLLRNAAVSQGLPEPTPPPEPTAPPEVPVPPPVPVPLPAPVPPPVPVPPPAPAPPAYWMSQHGELYSSALCV